MLGLSSEEVAARVENLSAEECNEIAIMVEQLQAGEGEEGEWAEFWWEGLFPILLLWVIADILRVDPLGLILFIGYCIGG